MASGAAVETPCASLVVSSSKFVFGGNVLKFKVRLLACQSVGEPRVLLIRK